MSAREGFQAAMIATRAKRPIFINRQMPNLSGRACVPAINLLIDNQSGTNATSHLDKGEILFAAPSSIGPFAERAEFGVIVQRDRCAPLTFERSPNWKSIPTRHDRRRHHHPFLGNDWSRHTDAD